MGLRRAYGVGEFQIAATIEAMHAPDVLVIEREQEVFAAIIARKAASAHSQTC